MVGFCHDCCLLQFPALPLECSIAAYMILSVNHECPQGLGETTTFRSELISDMLVALLVVASAWQNPVSCLGGLEAAANALVKEANLDFARTPRWQRFRLRMRVSEERTTLSPNPVQSLSTRLLYCTLLSQPTDDPHMCWHPLRS